MIKFTKDEKKVLLFLLAAIFIGTCVFYFKKINPRHPAFIIFDEGKTAKAEKVNINKADREKLVSLKNVGPVLAARIISYRKTNGPFARTEDIMDVKGIGRKKYESIKDRITVE